MKQIEAIAKDIAEEIQRNQPSFAEQAQKDAVAMSEGNKQINGCQDCQKARQGHWPIYSSTCPQCTERMLEAGKEEYK